MLRFALSGLAALLAVVLVSLTFVRRAGDEESIREARDITRLLARGVVEPKLTDAVLRQRRSALADLDRVVRARVLEPPVVRVKLWSADGRIVYSDEPRLIGSRYRLGAEERDILARGGVEAEISDLTRPENRFERRSGELLEVYLPVHTRDGTPLLFEAYQRYSSVTASGRRLWLAFIPALVGALILLWLVQIPLAWALTRRLERGRRERERLLEHAVEASDLERRRIASDLHDGVVQDLAGMAFTLAGAAERARGNGVSEVLQGAAEGIRQSLRRLRSLLVEIYPPNLESAGLESALADLLAPLAGRGITSELDVPSGVRLDPSVEQLVFRTAQEALRNVAEHAQADHVTVRLREAGGRATLVVEDDGRGFDSATAARRREEGHLGLALLSDRAADLGGSLQIDSKPGEGTRVLLEAADE